MKAEAAQHWRRACWILSLGTLIGLSCAGQIYFSSMTLDKPVAWSRAWRAALTDWYLLAILFWPTYILARQFPLERPFRYRHWAIHLAASGLFAVLHLAAYVLVRAVVFPADHFAFGESFNFWFVRRFHGNLFYYWTFALAAHAIISHQRLREREIRAADLEARLARTQLEALKAQLQPHFLFNTLNTISELLHENPEAADRMLTQLSDLLRLSLKTVDRQEVALEDELAFIEPYLDIQRVRLGDRLKVNLEIDPETAGAQVPYLLLQPLIENAVRHGIARRRDGGLVELISRRDNGKLKLVVRDSGLGICSPLDQPIKEGIGLSNIRHRLQCLYGKDYEFTFGNHPAGGFEVAVRLPFRKS